MRMCFEVIRTFSMVWIAYSSNVKDNIVLRFI